MSGSIGKNINVDRLYSKNAVIEKLEVQELEIPENSKISVKVSEIESRLIIEENIRETNDDTLQSNIDTESQLRKTNDDTLQSNIDAESQLRKTNDDTLQSNIDAESQLRKTNDDTLQSNIDAESASRVSADDTLQSNIDKESQLRKTEIETKISDLGKSISTEALSIKPLRWNQLGNELIGTPLPRTEGGYYGYNRFGRTVSLNEDGTLLAAGAWTESNEINGNIYDNGTVYLYKFENNNWTQIKTFNTDKEEGFIFYGCSIALSNDGKTLVISSIRGTNSDGKTSGFVDVWENINNNWTKTSTFEGNNNFGRFCRVSLSSNKQYLAIGAYYERPNIHIYKRNNNNLYTLFKSLNTNDYTSENLDDNSIGIDVDISDNLHFVASDPSYNNSNGLVMIFRYNTSINNFEMTNLLQGPNSSNYYGISNSINKNGDIIAVGVAPNTLENPNAEKKVMIYKYDTSNKYVKSYEIKTTNNKPQININNFTSFGYGGIQLSNDGNRIVISESSYDVLQNNGGFSVYEYIENENTWNIISNKVFGNETESIGYYLFDQSVSISGNGNIISQGYYLKDTKNENFTLEDLGKVINYSLSNVELFGADKTGININDTLKFEQVYVRDKIVFRNNNVNLGSLAGNLNASSNCISIGYKSGYIDSGTKTVSIGYQAGSVGQSDNSVAIGPFAGNQSQSSNSVAIGINAGKESQGETCVAIGRAAAQFSQHSNTIVLSADNSGVDTDRSDALFIKPIREETNTSSLKQLCYNASTGEITFA